MFYFPRSDHVGVYQCRAGSLHHMLLGGLKLPFWEVSFSLHSGDVLLSCSAHHDWCYLTAGSAQEFSSFVPVLNITSHLTFVPYVSRWVVHSRQLPHHNPLQLERFRNAGASSKWNVRNGRL